MSVAHLVKIVLVILSPVNFPYDYSAFKSRRECRCLLSVKVHIKSVGHCFFPTLKITLKCLLSIFMCFPMVNTFQYFGFKKGVFFSSKLLWSLFCFTVKREAFFFFFFKKLEKLVFPNFSKAGSF